MSFLINEVEDGNILVLFIFCIGYGDEIRLLLVVDFVYKLINLCMKFYFEIVVLIVS